MEIIEIQRDLNQWFSQFPERGSTWYFKNQEGYIYITYDIRATRVDISDAIQRFKSDIEEEINKTGIVSVRQKPCVTIIKDFYFLLKARIVAYHGNIWDSIIPPRVWHELYETSNR